MFFFCRLSLLFSVYQSLSVIAGLLSAVCWFVVHHCRVFTILMYALSLYCYQLDDILSFGQYLKLSLSESSVLMAFTWSVFSTYFFSWFPFLTYPDELLLEVLPCYLHIVFTFTTNFLWSCILLYIHHRTQIAIDARKCGVWERLGSGGNNNPSGEQQPQQAHKCPNWRHGHKYTQSAVVTSSSKLYKLISSSSSYPYAPMDILLAYRRVYLPLLATETGPLFKSRVLSYLLMAVLASIGVVLAAMFVLPAQVLHCLHCTTPPCLSSVFCFPSHTHAHTHAHFSTLSHSISLSDSSSCAHFLSLSLFSTTWAACCWQPPIPSWCMSPARTTT